MNIAVGIGCLVVVTLLAGVNGFSLEPEIKEYQSERQSGCRPLRRCRRAGGTCQRIGERCNGNLVTERGFCRRSITCGCCIETPPGPLGCVYGTTSYPSGYILNNITCVVLECKDGVWIAETHNPLCGWCQVYGEPHIQPYDLHNISGVIQTQYDYNGAGCYVISQLTDPTGTDVIVGVYSKFEKCSSIDGNDYSSVKSINYHEEPDIDIEVIFVPSFCDPSTGPCEIEVKANSGTGVYSVTKFPVTVGPVLVLRLISGGHTCIIIVGTKGISVTACQFNLVYAYAIIKAMPDLKQPSTSNHQLCGLCDRFTGGILHDYKMRDGRLTTNTTVFAHSWKLGPPESEYCYAEEDHHLRNERDNDVDRCTNATVLSEIKQTCHDITKGICAISVPQCAAFNESCQFDLCVVPDPDSYVEGYARHMRMHQYFAQLS